MSDLITTLRAIVREELSRHRLPELGIVTSVFAREDASNVNNHQISVRLRSTGVELPRAPVAVGRPGLSLLPRVDDLVLVAFIDGDINAPVVISTVYDSGTQPPIAKAEEVVYVPPDDADFSVRRMYFELPSGTKVTVDDDRIHVESGGTEVIVERDGDVSISAAGKLTLQAKGDVSIDAGGNLTLSAQQNIDVKGLVSTLEGQSQAQVKAPSIGLAGMTQFSPS